MKNKADTLSGQVEHTFDSMKEILMSLSLEQLERLEAILKGAA